MIEGVNKFSLTNFQGNSRRFPGYITTHSLTHSLTHSNSLTYYKVPGGFLHSTSLLSIGTWDKNTGTFSYVWHYK